MLDNPIERLNVYTKEAPGGAVIDVLTIAHDLIFAAKIGVAVGVGPDLEELIHFIRDAWASIDIQVDIPKRAKQ
jgi:hypothetical protein